MDKKLKRFLVLICSIVLMNSCYFHPPMFYDPDITLQDNGRTCISIPLREALFDRNMLFDIEWTSVQQQGSAEDKIKHYNDSVQQNPNYSVKAGECIRFNYNFQNNVTYEIGFRTKIQDPDKLSRVDKIWRVTARIQTDSSGHRQLLLNNEAKDMN